MPKRGQIGIFNPSYFEEVLVVRVHPEILDSMPLTHASEEMSFGKPDKKTSIVLSDSYVGVVKLSLSSF
jgi:polyphosphate kinase 2 (PPK2 family)